MAFAPGDIVQLKSGGPAMTVTGDSPDGVRCVWYGESSDEFKTTTIPAVCLDALILDDEEGEGEDADLDGRVRPGDL